MILEANERLEDLQCQNLKIVQNKTYYTFSSDSVVLANFVKTKKEDVCVEIGAGCGVISILVNAKNRLKKIYAFELQKEMFELCEKNIKLNNLQEKIEVFNENIKNFEKKLKKSSVDVVFSNPPYFKETNFKSNSIRKIAREEVCLDSETLIETASKLLKDGGAFYFCYTAQRACEVIYLCQKNKLKVKEMFFTENGKGQVKLVVIKAVKGANDGVKVYPNLITNEENGDYLKTLQTKNFLKG